MKRKENSGSGVLAVSYIKTHSACLFGLTLLLGAALLAGCSDDDEIVRVSGVSLDKSSLELVVGHSETLRATVVPEEAVVKEVQWASNNASVARVDNSGLVTAFAPGTASISVRSLQDAGKMAICTVTVVDAPTNKDPKDNPPKTGDPTKPAISGFSPAEAGFDAVLTIRGENFSAVPGENSVTLNGVPATVTYDTQSELRVKVLPNVHCTGPSRDCIGPVRVTVNGETATSSAEFTYVPTALVSTFAGSGPTGVYYGDFADGPGNVARFHLPTGIAIDSASNLYVTEEGNRIRKISSTGVVSTFAGNGKFDAKDGTGTDAQFCFPNGITIDTTTGNFYVTEPNRIRRVTPQAVVSTVAGGDTYGFAEGNGTNAQFASPFGIAIDVNKNLYVVDHGNHRIRKITSTGVVTTFAGSIEGFADGIGTSARFNWPTGIVIDKEGNFYVADPSNHRIRKITSQGVVSTLAGSSATGYLDGIGTAAQFDSPRGITIDTVGNLYVADGFRIRKVTPQAEVTTIAGSTQGLADGIGTAAWFSGPYDIAIDKDGSLYVADYSNHRIRKIEFK